MESGYQTSTLALVGSLALVTLWKNGNLQKVWGVLATNTNAAGVDMKAEATPIGIDLLGVAILTFIAGLSDDAGKMAVAVAVALWLIFLINRARGGSSSPLASLSKIGIAKGV